jgi:predicted nucleotidyltransferase
MTNPQPKPLEIRIREAAASLKEAGAREVFLFGSAARGALREGSDIDLAVAGLPPRFFFRAVDKGNRCFE